MYDQEYYQRAANTYRQTQNINEGENPVTEKIPPCDREVGP
jgi:hypothetical protein